MSYASDFSLEWQLAAASPVHQTPDRSTPSWLQIPDVPDQRRWFPNPCTVLVSAGGYCDMLLFLLLVQ